MTILCFVLSAFAAIPVGFYLYRKYYCHRYFKRLGIPTPETHWFYGNMHQLFCVDRQRIISKWSAKYGNLYGFYYGAMPILVISTPDAVEQVCVKQYSDFPGHMLLPVQPDPDDDPDHILSHMAFARGEAWKRYRAILSPAFSDKRLKTFLSSFAKLQEDLMELLKSKSEPGKAFEIRECFQYLTMEMITSFGFGLQSEAIKRQGRGDIVLEKMQELVASLSEPPKDVIFALCFTEVAPIVRKLLMFQMKYLLGFFGPIGFVMNVVRDIIKKRRAASSRNNDVLQMMMDATSLPNADDGEAAIISEVAREKAPFKSMTDPQMVSHCLMLFSTAYETTSTALALTCYLLAKNPTVQDKLLHELRTHLHITKKVEKLSEADYDTIVAGIPYIDWVCRETLRLYPLSLNVFTRQVANDTTLFGVPVPKTLRAVMIDTWSLHYDQSFWGPVDTSEYYPERFSPENSANRPESCFLAFGFGPRQCIGFRLALLQIKITLANILLRYRIDEPDGGYPGGEILVSGKGGPLVPVGGVQVKLIPRS